MPIISSQIISQHAQIDGRIDVLERHRDHNGVDYDISYLAAVGLDISAVLSARALKMGAAIDAAAAVEAEASNFELPISQVDFLKRFAPSERVDVYVAKRTDAAVEDAWNFVMAAVNGIRLGNPLTAQMLQLLEAKALITAARRAIIGAP